MTTMTTTIFKKKLLSIFQDELQDCTDTGLGIYLNKCIRTLTNNSKSITKQYLFDCF